MSETHKNKGFKFIRVNEARNEATLDGIGQGTRSGSLTGSLFF